MADNKNDKSASARADNGTDKPQTEIPDTPESPQSQTETDDEPEFDISVNDSHSARDTQSNSQNPDTDTKLKSTSEAAKSDNTSVDLPPESLENGRLGTLDISQGSDIDPNVCSAGLLLDKPDDSGIAMEKSPDKDCDSDNCDTVGAQSKRKSPDSDPVSTSNDTEAIVTDIESQAASICDTESKDSGDRDGDAEATTDSARERLEVVEEEDSSEIRMRAIRRRIRHIRSRDDSDSDDDSDDDSSRHNTSESMDHDQSHDSANQSDDDVVDIDLDPPKDTWCPLNELFRRERGFSNRYPSASMFINKCGGSVNLVQRLISYAKMDHHEGCVNALHFNETGTLLASGSDDLNIVVWKWVERKRFFSFDSGHRSNVFQSKFMPFTGDTHIVSCARDGQLRLAELSSTGHCKDTKRLAHHKGAAHKLALLHDSSHVFYSCGEDALTYEIDLRQDKPHKLSITKENNRKVALYSIHANPFKSHEYCVSGRDPYVRIFDKRMAGDGDNSGLVKKYCPHNITTGENSVQANVTCAVYNYNGQEIIGTYNDEDIYLFDTQHSDGADAIHRYRGHRNNATVKGVNFYGPKSEFIVSGSDCGNIFLWEKESEKVVQCFPGDSGGVVNVLEPHPEYPILATSGLDHDVKIWMPLAFEPTKLDGLKKTIKRNKKERDEERRDPAETMDTSLFWRLMQHFRRAARQRARQEGENVSSTDSDNSDDGSDDVDPDDDDDNPEEPMQCAPS